MKIAIYTISKNEEKYVNHWVNANNDSDYLIVGDTGSTDNTKEYFNHHNVKYANTVRVYDIRISPWRFDDARNAILALIPDDVDIAISVDMDEYMAPGWRSELEKYWVPGTTRISYTYHHALDANDNPISTFMADKAHARFGYRWQRPVHETVFSVGDEQILSMPSLVMFHNQDTNKSRQNYLPLLIQSHTDMPNCAQTLFWLAREYYSYKQQDKAVEHFKKYLAMNESTWSDERSEAMKYLSELMPHETLKWLRLSAIEASHRREVWYNLAKYYYDHQDWLNCYTSAKEGLKITNKCNNYLDNLHVWVGNTEDIAGIAAWNLDMKKESLDLFEKAIQISSNDQRIRDNYNIVKRLVI